MMVGIKYRQFIHYTLILCTLLIQTVILVFFYNEYFNEKKLAAIGKQLEDIRLMKRMAEDSKNELNHARDHLQKYLTHENRENLDMYFESLQKLTANIEKIKTGENDFPELSQKPVNDSTETLEINELKTLIETAYEESKKPLPKQQPPEIKKINLEKNIEEFDIEVSKVEDSVRKKKFIPRVIDAIKGEVSVKTDTVYISSKYGSTVDTAQIKHEIENTVSEIDKHYQSEIQKYKAHLSNVNSKTNRFYLIYDNLITASSELMDIYDRSVQELSSKFENDYSEQNSINTKIRKYTIMALMVLTFIVLILLMYYTRQLFVYENELKLANQRIGNHLNFKNRILGMLSHEIRSPLKIMNIFIDRIGRKTDDKSILENLKSIKFTNDSLLIQANQILEYTKDQTRYLEMNPVKFNLKNEIDSILEIFKPYIESAHNSFMISNQLAADLEVLADHAKIHQVFTNILGNATKFTQNGEIKVTVGSEPVDEKTIKMKVLVADTGIGISESDIEKIFEPYYKGVISDEVENMGAGLGLNLCREIIQLFDGNISVKSSLGKGTEVEFEMNLKKADD
ncbi:MAG: HAMP domain-containing sensor histidine kinase [Moheibacter sp.]